MTHVLELVILQWLAGDRLFCATGSVYCITSDLLEGLQTTLLQFLLINEGFTLHLKVGGLKPLLKVAAFVITWDLLLKLLGLCGIPHSIIGQNYLGRRALQVFTTRAICLLYAARSDFGKVSNRLHFALYTTSFLVS